MSTEKQKHTQEHEKNMANEMLNDMQIHFREEDHFYAEQVILPQESAAFSPHNKVSIVMCVNLHECWKKRCGFLNEPSIQMIVLKNEIVSMK